jgi:hypothetical protein
MSEQFNDAKHRKAIELAKKLLALSERGVQGEAENAGRMLQELLKKHGLTLDDIETVERHKCEYNIALKHQDLFFALCWHVIDKWNGNYWHKKADKRYIGVELTNAEQLELTAKFDFYVRHFDKQLSLFTRSFVQANKLYVKESNINDDHVPEMTEDTMIVLSMAAGMPYHKWQERLAPQVIDESHRLQ